MTEPLISVGDLALKWRWNHTRIRHLVRTGEIPHIRIGGRIWFRESVIDAWLAAKEQQPKVNDTPRAFPLSHEEECRRLGMRPDHRFA